MANRGYFSIRYAIPGYTFIFVVLVMNYPSVLEFVSSNGTPELLGAFLGFATLLSGSALGFLVSQFYFWQRNKKGGLLGVKEFEKITDILKDYGYITQTEKKDNIRIAGAILDMSFYLKADKEKELLGYVWRRWDMYTTLASTYYAIIGSLCLGYVYRIIYEITKFLSIPNQNYEKIISGIIPWLLEQGIILILVICGFIITFFIMESTATHMMKNYYPSFEAHVRYNLQNKITELKKIFPNYF